MKNELTFAKNDNLINILSNLDGKLNDRTSDLSYPTFVLRTIIKESTVAAIRVTAQQLLEKQQKLQDELDYLNSCVVFLYNQSSKQASLSSLTEGEINVQLEELTKSVQQFLSLRQTYQNVCLRFVSKHRQNKGSQLQAA